MTGPATLRPTRGNQAPGPASRGRAAGDNETPAGTPADKRKKNDRGTAAAIQ
jgi:hypothetical protein